MCQPQIHKLLQHTVFGHVGRGIVGVDNVPLGHSESGKATTLSIWCVGCRMNIVRYTYLINT